MTEQSRLDHARAGELAALSVDFTLSAAERAELDRHLAQCGPCNDLLAAYRADAEALRSEAFAHAPERVRAAVGAALIRPAPRAGFRTDLLIAAALLGALLVAGLVAAGAFRQRDQLVVAPSSTPLQASPTAPAPGATTGATSEPGSSSPPSAPAPTQSAGVSPVQLPLGISAAVVTDRLFIRSQPGVGADSTRIQVLDQGTLFRLVEGPVPASDYWWYRVRDISVPLSGGATEGWVASADHDGTRWIGPAPAACQGYQFSDDAITVHSLSELQIGILGTWAGCVTMPWAPSYWVTIVLRGDGTYSGHGEANNESPYPAFYWGTDADSALKRYTLNDLQASLKGIGEIDLVGLQEQQDLIIGRADLRNIKLMGDRLDFEVFASGSNGPLSYYLYRIQTPT